MQLTIQIISYRRLDARADSIFRGALKEKDSRFKKMASVEPPIVEQKDLQTLNQAYRDKIIKMTHMYLRLNAL